ncbi:MAG: hypothetical protein A2600_07185 [Candidatus Lambdaproteobacteria bacterium RIFOXYD1_FULL_56_27]|uniref:N-acetyltransferase domain-containing protein n=1 Tax=Candidatus Lambdaproteobacteria bacterium RIFOXYD2_FULL_56_26 TaxID=1817773 RepID=A0A1F6GQE3_9PROT|nr:MAG: hypothetical protein A2557_05845 [Candidatus Lambdaproteobacteria bacterium RIFOXYD2_FULL_56_26]OGH03715.1 MAG: hypothetical protein A2426_00635 [Candidatus Lambdaproteobacteria bacterium RIFOXYC1_FULL_56_13]OGH07299.1 MAG: hypothetical protein A2600_07185 [Candidatus Lambdaproteobacteria bacterium RIFOXYD1_FULL_56_27]
MPSGLVSLVELKGGPGVWGEALVALDRENLPGEAWELATWVDFMEVGVQVILGLEGQRPVAFLSWQPLDQGLVEILKLAVTPASRRQGWAERLIGTLVEKIGPQTKVWLELRESNLPAQTLYLKQGFVSIGRRKQYYSNPVEDGLLFEKGT